MVSPNWVSELVAVRAVAQIAEDLIEGAVLLDDVDDVLDVVAQELHHVAVVAARLGAVEVVLGDLLGEAARARPGRAPAR